MTRLTFALALLEFAATAGAQSPPAQDFRRQQVFASYQEFKNQLTAISAVADAAQRRSQLDTLWSKLKDASQVPYVQSGQVAFLYRGPQSSVAWAGDFTGWDASATSSKGVKLPGTDLWLLEKSFPADARLDYKIVAGGNWILDPANPLQIWSGFGPNSELRMPDYVYPQVTVRKPDAPRGEVTGDVKIASTRLGYEVNYRVYTPAGYAADQLKNLPVVYVTDGHEYAADHLGGMVIVLDNLIASGAIQPAMAVFIDPRDAVTGANRRMTEYVKNDKFVAFLADELAPAVDRDYRTRATPAGRTILGASLGGLNAAYVGARRFDVFQNIAVQSPASFAQFAPQTLKLYATEPLAGKLRLYVTAGTIGDGDAGPKFAAVLAADGHDYTLVLANQGHSWGQWRGELADILISLVGPAPCGSPPPESPGSPARAAPG